MPENLPPDDTAETQKLSAGDPLGAPASPPPGDPPPPPPPPPAAAVRKLTRSSSDRVLGGVCGGIGAYFGIDAIIVRLAAVALLLFGGAGALLYVAALLLVPTAAAGALPDGQAAPPTDRTKLVTVLGVVLVVCVAGPLLFFPAIFIGGLLVPVAFLVLAGLGVAWLVTGRRPGRDAGSIVKATAVGIGVLVLLAALFVGAFWAAGLGGGAVVAALVIAAGVALVAGAFARPVRWLILPALAVAIPAGFVAAAGIELDGGIGDRSYRPTAAAQLPAKYELGVGAMVVDLRDADLPPGDRRLRLELGMGDAIVIVDESVCVSTDAELGMGLVQVFDRDHAGVDVDVQDRAEAGGGRARLLLDADLGLGHLEIRHTAPAEFDGWDAYDRGPFGEDGRFRGPGRFEEGRFDPETDDPGDGRPGNRACA